MAKLLSLFTTSLILLCECYAQFSGPCNSTPPIDYRTDNSDIIVKGTVLRKLEELTTTDNTYPIDVVVTEVYKGYKTFGNISSITLSAPNSDVPNVYRFGNFRWNPCLTEVRPHAEYIFFLTTGQSSPALNPLIGGLKGQEDKEVTQDEGRVQLQPQYKQGVTDPVEEFSVNRERMILTKLGWSSWGSWSPCSDPCGVEGTQSRKRTCDKDFADACEGAVKEVRQCNLFGCGQMKNLLEIMNLQDRPTGVRHPKNRHSAYRITPEASITISTSMIYTHVFPDEFSILLSLKPRPSGSLDNSNLYAVVMVGRERELQLAIRIGRHPTLLYHHTPNGRRDIVFEDYTITRDWHSIAFGIRRNSVTLVADCSIQKVQNLPDGDEITIGTDGFTSIGSPSGGVEGISDITFSGDIEQFVILPDPDAASRQCSSPERMLPLPPEDLFDYYPVRDPDSADVPFDIDPAQVNPSLDISTTPSTVRIPTTPSTTDNIFQSTLIPSPSTTEPSGEVTEKPDFIDGENAIPPVNIIPGDVEPGIIVIPSRGDHPDIIVDPEVIRLPSSIEPEAERSIKQTTEGPKKIAAPEGPEKNHDQRQIKGSPANIPLKVTDMRPGDGAYPPGDGYPRDNGDLFDDASSGDHAYNEGGVEWSTWSTCSTTCGLGTRYRFGFCQKDSTHLDCRRGHTITAQRKSCKLNNCEGVMQWSDWSVCSRTCGENSVRTRMAFCPDERAHDDCIRPGQTVVERESCDVPACSDVCAKECQNGGVCRNGECVCPPGYSGQTCQHQTCSPQCRNGGVCLGSNVCRCPDGTLPPYCTRRCTPDCQNGGTCSTGNRCQCPTGYSGFRCETPVCTSGCRNGGRCVGPDKCQCTSGYGGQDCSEAQCLLGCQNGGTCIRPDYCRCPPAYRGSRCEIGYCRERCRNGGTCIGADTCKCTRGYTGTFCKRSKCPSGCPPSMTCVGHNRCIPKSFAPRGTKHSSTGRKTWCPLTSFSQQIKTSYVKPVIRSIRISCGPFGLQSCNSQRLEYTIAYRTAYRTSYRCANRG